jgi:Ca-activated chloride channel family protein
MGMSQNRRPAMTINPVRRALLAASLALPALPALAQKTQLIAPAPQPPRLAIVGAADLPVTLRSVRIDAEIAGSVALTEVELVFHNPNRRVLEGELQFPLLDGQTITGFAMDVDGKMREAVPVEKARGQAVFEDITRARIDPGLLQQTQGNNFKLRVYPLFPGKTKTVVIRYGETLTGAAERRYRLPIEYAGLLPAFALNLRVQGAAAAPVISAKSLGEIELRRAGAEWIARIERADVAARGTLELALPAAKAPFAQVQQFNGRTYFQAEVPVQARSVPRTPPRRIAIAWDASGSGASRDHGRELALLDSFFRWMKDGEVVLTRLRDVADAGGTFQVSGGNWSELRRALSTIVYDGATHLGAWQAAEGVEEVLLFTDGLHNYGERGFDPQGAMVHAISAATRADADALRQLAEKSGGRFVDLGALTPAAAASVLSQSTLRVLSADGQGVASVVLASVYPASGRVMVAGELLEKDALLRIETGLAGQSSKVTEIRIRNSAFGRMAAPAWARLKIAELEAEHDLNRAEIRRLGKSFGLVTRETSLIVLDRVEDYVRHEIAPPAELLAQYERLRAAGLQRREADKRAHLERIVRLFEQKQAWWAKSFPKDARAAKQISKDDRREDRIARAAPAAPAAREAAKAEAAPRRDLAMDQRALSSAAGASAGARNEVAAAEPSGGIAIRLQPARSDAAYAKRMREADPAKVYRVYLDEKPGFASSTAFYLDAADLLLAKHQPELALRALSNLAEMDLENRHVLRILGYRLLQMGQPQVAVPVFRKVLELAPEEPQSYRDLGLALAAAGQPQKAIEMLYEVVAKPWHTRFPEIELITLAELNAIVATSEAKLETGAIDPRLLRNLPLDLRVILSWDADNTDIDLWVTDPNGEKSYYGNPLSYQGGRMSQDFTGGYGPEEFSLRHAKPGKYTVEAQFYGHRQQIVAGATTLSLKLATGFGSKAQKEKSVTLRLAGRSEVVFVGEFTVGAQP